MTHSSLLKMVIFSRNFPWKIVIFHSFLYVYQRVIYCWIISCTKNATWGYPIVSRQPHIASSLHLYSRVKTWLFKQKDVIINPRDVQISSGFPWIRMTINHQNSICFSHPTSQNWQLRSAKQCGNASQCTLLVANQGQGPGPWDDPCLFAQKKLAGWWFGTCFIFPNS